MDKLAALIRLALLLSIGFASAQTTATPGPAAKILKPDQCGELWDKSVAKRDVATQADATQGGNFAGSMTLPRSMSTLTIDNEEFAAAFAKGNVHGASTVQK
jgi:hypothetical protein